MSPFVKRVLCLSLLCLATLLAGCHYGNGAVTSTNLGEGESYLRRIAVIPFLRVVPEDANAGVVRCPLCGAIVRAEESPAGSEKRIEALFIEFLSRSGKFDIVPTDRAQGIFTRIASENMKAPLQKILRGTGEELEADGVVVGYVYRFRERKGYTYSVQRPASVAFEIHLVRVKDGAVLWRGIFDKTQTSLMENLLQISSFYREKGQWVTADALAEEGMEQLLKTFPGLT